MHIHVHGEVTIKVTRTVISRGTGVWGLLGWHRRRSFQCKADGVNRSAVHCCAVFRQWQEQVAVTGTSAQAQPGAKDSGGCAQGPILQDLHTAVWKCCIKREK